MKSVASAAAVRPQESRFRNVHGERVLASLLILAGLFVYAWQCAPAVPEAWRLALPDRDDSLRLVEVRDLLAGQGWFDLTLYRYLPPDGVLMHWSRLVDLPPAAGIVVLTPLVGAEWAEKLVVTFWPGLLFAVYAGMVGWGAWRLFGSLAAGVAILVAGQMIVFSDLFAPGRIDHHNIQIILIAGAAIGFGFTERSAAAAGLASGILCGASLAVGLETLPFMACIGMAFAIGWIGLGEVRARQFAQFGAGLSVTTLALFCVQTAPSLWLAPACDALSAPWLMLTVGGGVVATALARATPLLCSWRARLAAAAAAGCVLILAFASLFPACLDGPYHMVPQPFRALWLGDIVEAFPFWRFLQANPNAALQALMPVALAAAFLTVGAWRETGASRGFLALLASLLWLGVILAQLQMRTIYIASAILPLAAGWFVSSLVSGGQERAGASARALGAVGAVLLFGIPWAVGVAAFSGETPTGEKAPRGAACNDPRAMAALNALPPGLVLGPIDLGPALLLHTRHSVVAAGYHRAPSGIIAAIEAFSGSESDALRAARRVHADYLVICSNWMATTSGKHRPFAAELAEGGSASWLQLVTSSNGPLKIWRVAVERCRRSGELMGKRKDQGQGVRAFCGPADSSWKTSFTSPWRPG